MWIDADVISIIPTMYYVICLLKDKFRYFVGGQKYFPIDLLNFLSILVICMSMEFTSL